jgi:hypothetical protein
VSILGSITANSWRMCSMFRKSVAFLCICGACLGALLRWPASSSLLAEMPPPALRRLNLSGVATDLGQAQLILGSATQSCLRT